MGWMTLYFINPNLQEAMHKKGCCKDGIKDIS